VPSIFRTTSFRSFVVAAIAGVAFATGASAQAQGITSEQANEILTELKGIRAAMEKMAAGAGQAAAPVEDTKVNYALADGGFSLGKPDAPLVIVEYMDLQCPFCQKYHVDSYDLVLKNWVDTGKARYISRDFPLEMLHPNARAAALAARCAAEQGKYWQMRHVLLKNAGDLGGERITSYAREIGLDMTKYGACVTKDAYKTAIDKDIAEGQTAGVTGTPSFVVGHLANGHLVGERVVGAMPYADLDAKFKEVAERPVQ
jgi:protein-disulfide isomerase